MTAPTHLPRPLDQLSVESQGGAPGRGRLSGRRIMVVGAGQRATVDDPPPVGNGRAISMLFAREGASLACVDISAQAAQATCDLVAREGGRAFAEQADVGDAASIDPLVERCKQRLGGLDGLVMVVGISSGKPLSALTADIWDHEQAVNVRSNMLFARKALLEMEEGGSIVLISSLAALRNSSGNPSYETAKAAQVSLARSVAMAGQSRGIRCNAVLPGLMDTPMGRDATRRRPARVGAPLPFGRQGTGWEVAYASLFLVSGESSYVNAHALVVDGGLVAGVARPGKA